MSISKKSWGFLAAIWKPKANGVAPFPPFVKLFHKISGIFLKDSFPKCFSHHENPANDTTWQIYKNSYHMSDTFNIYSAIRHWYSYSYIQWHSRRAKEISETENTKVKINSIIFLPDIMCEWQFWKRILQILHYQLKSLQAIFFLLKDYLAYASAKLCKLIIRKRFIKKN